MFHAFTECDTVSFFAGKVKGGAWKVLQAYPEATGTFLSLFSGPDVVDDSCLKSLGLLFVVLLYDRTS